MKKNSKNCKIIQQTLIIVGMLILSFLIIVPISCTRLNVKIYRNAADYSTTYSLPLEFAEVNTEDVGFYGNAGISITMLVSENRKDTIFNISAASTNNKSINISVFNKLKLIIDGTRIYLDCRAVLSSQEKVPSNVLNTNDVYFFDSAIYKADKTVLTRLINSNSVEFVIYGKDGDVSGRLSTGNIKTIRKFYNSYIQANNNLDK